MSSCCYSREFKSIFGPICHILRIFTFILKNYFNDYLDHESAPCYRHVRKKNSHEKCKRYSQDA